MNTHLKILHIFVIIILAVLIIESCKKKEDPDLIIDPVLENDYEGTLQVYFSNTLPPWSVSTSMNVDIYKDLGTISVDQGILSYSGDTIIQEDSRLTRTGEWVMNPIGTVGSVGGKIRIEIDAQVTVQNDVQSIYAKDDEGNWQLVNETTFNETPNADLAFDLDDAVISGSVVSVVVATGSIVWTLNLTPAITP